MDGCAFALAAHVRIFRLRICIEFQSWKESLGWGWGRVGWGGLGVEWGRGGLCCCWRGHRLRAGGTGSGSCQGNRAPTAAQINRRGGWRCRSCRRGQGAAPPGPGRPARRPARRRRRAPGGGGGRVRGDTATAGRRPRNGAGGPGRAAP